ncbi:MAG: amidohydrolase [Flavobacteriales bacterium]
MEKQIERSGQQEGKLKKGRTTSLASPLRLFALLFVLIFSACGYKSKKVDLVLHNGRIHPMARGAKVQEAMAVDSGRIVALGAERAIRNKYAGERTIDLAQKNVYPGFIDAHAHFLGYGLAQQRVDLRGADTWDKVIKRVQRFAEEDPEKEQIRGRGWDLSDSLKSSTPDRSELDERFPEKPVLLQRIDGHAAVANEAALNRAGIKGGMKIQGGLVKTKEGKATGYLLDAAVERVLKHFPEPSREEKAKALRTAEEACLEKGLTTVTDAGLSREEIQLIDSLQKEDELKIRIHAMVSADSADMVHYLEQGPYRTSRLTVNAFKFYMDGALGSRGALLLRPYSDVVEKMEYGVQKHSKAWFKRWATRIAESSFQICTHCIGDSANRIVLDVYSELLEPGNDKRWRIEHAQVVHPKDIGKFGTYNIIPSVQPTHATTDMDWAESRLGSERLQYAYAYKDLLEQNGMIPLGTDFPVEDIDPMETFYAAVTRKNEAGEPEEGFMTEQALTRKQALKGMTIWAALAAEEEKSRGTLEEGKVADLTIVGPDLEKLPMEKVRTEEQVVATFVGGECLYGCDEL